MTVLFLVVSFLSIVLAYMLDGGNITGLFGLTAFITVIGATIGAVGISFPFSLLKNVGKLILIAFRNEKHDLAPIVEILYGYSLKARRDGVLSLESELGAPDLTPFLKKGLTLLVDGTDQQLLRTILETDIEQTSRRHHEQSAIFESAGGYAPTMGIIGTVMGLIHVLSNLAEPETLGSKIAIAFLATLYGIGTANLIYLPIASRLRTLDAREYNEKVMITEGLVALAAGENPNVVIEKLKAFLSPEELENFSIGHRFLRR